MPLPSSPSSEVRLLQCPLYPFCSEAYQNVSRVFGATFVVMGMLSILINGTFVGALCLKKRRHAPVFYTLILNFAVVDCFKGEVLSV